MNRLKTVEAHYQGLIRPRPLPLAA